MKRQNHLQLKLDHGLGCLLVITMMTSLTLAAALAQAPAVPAQPQPDEKTMKLLSIAETEHEIIQLRIEEKNYPQAIKELQVLLDLKLPVVYEPAVFDEIKIVLRKLIDLGQKEYAYQAIELGMKYLQTPQNKADLLRVKAGLLKKEGQLDKALEAYKESIRILEK